MAEKHTAEPWSAEYDGGMNTADARIVANAANERRRVMKSSMRPNYLALVWTMEDARRIVDCVNALRFVPPAALRGEVDRELGTDDNGHYITIRWGGRADSTEAKA